MQYLVLALILIATNSWADSVTKIDDYTVEITETESNTIRIGTADVRAKIARLEQAKANAQVQVDEYQAQIDKFKKFVVDAGVDLQAVKPEPKLEPVVDEVIE